MQVPTILDFIPLHDLRMDQSGDLELFVTGVLQPALDLLWAEVERFAAQAHPDTADEDSLDDMLFGVGNPFAAASLLTESRKRLLVKGLVPLYRRFGTDDAIVRAVRLLTGLEVEVVYPASTTFWILDEHVLSDQHDAPEPPDPTSTDIAILGAGTDFERYSFQLRVPAVLTAEQRVLITEVVKVVKPAHTHLLGFLEPGSDPDPDHVELNVSELGDAGSDGEFYLHD